MGRRAGFTLIELLIVLAVVGILASIGYVSILRYIQKSQLIEGQQRLAQSLNKARDGARRRSQNQTVSWTGSAGNYTMTVAGEPVVLPAGVLVSEVPALTPSSFVYLAPHGRISAADLEFKMSGMGGLTGYIRVLGVTGKVIRDTQ